VTAGDHETAERGADNYDETNDKEHGKWCECLPLKSAKRRAALAQSQKIFRSTDDARRREFSALPGSYPTNRTQPSRLIGQTGFPPEPSVQCGLETRSTFRLEA